MAGLKQVLAFNMKEQRRVLGISQAVLAERINTSTNYIAMIKLERKVPSVSLRKLHKTVLEDIEKAVGNVISARLNEVESSEDYQNKAIKT